MKNLAAKYSKLKKQVGGNREKVGYEETFGMPQEEFWKVTMPNKWIRRILAEVEFCIRLNKEQNGKWNDDVEKALDFLQTAMDIDAVLTKNTCLQAEEMLLPLQTAAKEYELILAAHAHIDMNWMWGWQETVAITIATFRTMLDIMNTYPDFCFSQSQASVYKIVEDYAPELMPEMKQRIAEGRWEVTASAWVETDKNMPSTESLINHIYYTRKYLKEHWDINPESLDLDFSPDTFGHSANIPELNNFGGVKYYYHCRGLDGDNALYRWKAPSGQEVMVYREQYWYNSGITPLPAIGLIDVSKRSGGLKTGLVVYGVGDHGGGPTRRDIERAIDMSQWPIFPKIRFGTFHDYFHAAEAFRSKLPVVNHELNFIFPGCYTTQSRIKMGNRHAEAALFEAQGWNAIAARNTGLPYREDQFESAWQSVLFTHFHDILTGSCVQESREHGMGQFAHAMAVANSRASLSLNEIANSIDTSSIHIGDDILDSQSEGAGVGYGLSNFSGIPATEQGRGLTRIFHVFNSSSHNRTQSCEITVWDWMGDMRYIQMEDGKGQTLETQMLDTSLQPYWDHKYFRILVNINVPAFGYATVILKDTAPEEYEIYFQPEKRTDKPTDNFVLENRYLRAEFDFRNGELLSLRDLISQKEMLRKGETGGLRYVTTEHDSSSAWQIGRYTKVCRDCFETIKITAADGTLRNGFIVEQTVHNSKVKVTVTLEKDAKALTFRYEIDWHEISRKGEPVPVLIYQLPLADVEKYLYDVPGGAQYRESMQIDVPGLQYGAAIGKDGRAAFIVTDSKYGYRGCEGNLVSTLINATTNPDPYPERGIHNFILHIGAEKGCPKELEELAFDLNHPLRYQSGSIHSGKLSLDCSFMGFDSQTTVISGVSAANGKLEVRMYETCGLNDNITLSLPGYATKAELTDLFGHSLSQAQISDSKISFVVEPFSIIMVKIENEC